MQAGWDSFRGMLTRACTGLKPKRILEWGPGASTHIMLRECPGAVLLSIENEPEWFQAALRRFGKGSKMNTDALGQVVIEKGESKLFLVQKRLSLLPGLSEGYVTWPLYVRGMAGIPGIEDGFDLVFVDGRSRCDCLVVAKQVLAPGGVVLLHDAQRPNYQPPWDLFKYRHFNVRAKTAAMSDSTLEFLQSPKRVKAVDPSNCTPCAERRS